MELTLCLYCQGILSGQTQTRTNSDGESQALPTLLMEAAMSWLDFFYFYFCILASDWADPGCTKYTEGSPAPRRLEKVEHWLSQILHDVAFIEMDFQLGVVADSLVIPALGC